MLRLTQIRGIPIASFADENRFCGTNCTDPPRSGTRAGKVRNRRKGDTPHFAREPIADCDPSLGIETGQNPVPAEHARFAEARFAP
jgi:hypothetical protein